MSKSNNRQNKSRDLSSMSKDNKEVQETKVEKETPLKAEPSTPVKPAPTSKTDVELEKKLNEYVIGMTNNEELSVVAKLQQGLFLTLKGILAKEDPEEFRKSWNTLLRFANENKQTIFNEENLFRGAAGWTGSDVEFGLFRRVLYLIIRTADHTKRAAALKDISLERVGAGLKPQQFERLLNFYG